METVKLAQRSKLLLKEDSVFQQALTNCKDNLTAQWVACTDPTRREEIWHELWGLQRVEENLQSFIDNAEYEGLTS